MLPFMGPITTGTPSPYIILGSRGVTGVGSMTVSLGHFAMKLTCNSPRESWHDAGSRTYEPVKRSHSVCAQGGINASVNTKGEGDSPQVHLEETVYGGDFLANQPPVKGNCLSIQCPI